MAAAHAERFSHEDVRVLRLLRGKGDDLDWLPTEWDWGAFAKTCDRHHLAALVFCRLKASRKAVPLGLFEFLRRRFYEISTNNYSLAKELVGITELFQEHRIPVLAYKGPVVAMVA